MMLDIASWLTVTPHWILEKCPKSLLCSCSIHQLLNPRILFNNKGCRSFELHPLLLAVILIALPRRLPEACAPVTELVSVRRFGDGHGGAAAGAGEHPPGAGSFP